MRIKSILHMSAILNSTPTTKRGAFILFEGIDRCGKSTQSSSLASKIPNAELIRFPARETVIGQIINSYLTSSQNLSDETIHLLFSANRWEASSTIESKLNAGITLICDRYAYSGVAFSAAKGMDLQWCKNSDIGLIAPDCIIYLDLSEEDASERGSYGEERYEKVDFQRKVREKFMQLKDVDEHTSKWHVLDAKKTKEELHDEIAKIASQVTEQCAEKPLSKLWN